MFWIAPNGKFSEKARVLRVAEKVRRLMKKMCLTAIYQKPNTSKSCPYHKVYPYLLRNLDVVKPNQVWCTDITYIAMPKGFMYLVAIMDWHSRRVLSWRISNTMEADFCIESLEEALHKHGAPEIFNTDQGVIPPAIKAILE